VPPKAWSALACRCPPAYLQAMLRNQGQTVFDAAGNVVTKDGRPWIGGNPFHARTAEETLAGQMLSWGGATPS
jgi:hypothetical protein